MTTIFRRKNFKLNIPGLFSSSQYVESMVYIRIFMLKISVFYRVENQNGTMCIILSYYIDPDVLNQLFLMNTP